MYDIQNSPAPIFREVLSVFVWKRFIQSVSDVHFSTEEAARFSVQMSEMLR